MTLMNMRSHFWQGTRAMATKCPACKKYKELTYVKYEGREICKECAKVWEKQNDKRIDTN